MPKRLIIAAACARPFVQAAVRAGHEVIALDAFADADTTRAARHCYRLDYARGGFDAGELLQTLEELRSFEADGFVYGSGFERSPGLLEAVQGFVPVIGNRPQVLRRLKTPRRWFEMLDALQIPYPPVRFSPPEHSAGWLMKSGGGSGGTHVRQCSRNAVQDDAQDVYYQREVRGEAVSLLFVAASGQAQVVGFNRQWTSPTPALPYRYGGAASRAVLADEVRARLASAAQDIAREAGLSGFNSLDAIVTPDGVRVLEVNPRLSATFELYSDDRGELFDLHLATAAGVLLPLPSLAEQARAQHIVYAPQPLRVPLGMDWPVWTADLPHAGSVVSADAPLCSVIVEGGDAEQARAKALERERELLAKLTSSSII